MEHDRPDMIAEHKIQKALVRTQFHECSFMKYGVHAREFLKIIQKKEPIIPNPGMEPWNSTLSDFSRKVPEIETSGGKFLAIRGLSRDYFWVFSVLPRILYPALGVHEVK